MPDSVQTSQGPLRVDDVATYYAFDGERREVRVTGVHQDIKDGRAGFDGIMPDGESVWGYASQVEHIVPREDIR